MSSLVLCLLMFAVGANSLASSLRMDSADNVSHTSATQVRGKRHRKGNPMARAPDGRSYIYIAGVPGMGQEFWRGALRRCTDSKLCEPRGFPFYTGMLMTEERRVNEHWVKEDGQHPDRIVPMNLVSPNLERQPDHVFYRAFSSKLSGFEDPRLPLYFKLAHGNGDGLKVVVLTRSNERALLAWNMKRYHQNAEETDTRLSSDIRTLAMQLSSLPPDSYRCVSFEEMLYANAESMKPLVRMGGLKSQAFAVKLHWLLTKGMYGCGFTGSGLETHYDCPHFHIKAPKTRAALDLLEDLCDPADFPLQHQKQTIFAKKIQWLVE